MDFAHVWVIEESGGNVCVIGILVVWLKLNEVKLFANEEVKLFAEEVLQMFGVVV